MAAGNSIIAHKVDDNLGNFDSKKASSHFLAHVEASAQLGTNKESRLSVDEEKDIVAPLVNNHDIARRRRTLQEEYEERKMQEDLERQHREHEELRRMDAERQR